MWKKITQDIDFKLLIPILLLCGIGLVMVYSASAPFAIDLGLPANHFFKRQLLSFVIGFAGFIFATFFSYTVYKRLIKIILLVCVGSLVAVLFVGVVNNSAQSWFSIGGLHIQPAEYAKLGLIVYLAAIFSKKQQYIASFKRAIVPPLLVVLLFFFLIAQQPDLGTAMIVVGTAGVVIICSGMRLKHIFSLVGLGLSALTALFFFMLQSYQAARFTAAYAPFTDPDGIGYQIINAYIAIASGGLTGRGLGESIQKYGYLPASHTDFIIAVIAEELGVIGVAVVIALLAFIIYYGFRISLRANDTFGSLLAIGITGMIGIQTIVNLGSIVGLLPVTGVTLPLVSYGGSSLTLLLFSLGILMNISRHTRRQLSDEPHERQRVTSEKQMYQSIHT